MTNSTTPDSPKCPTCRSSRRELRNTPTNAANPQYWKNTSDWEPSYYKCTDPFHTSLPTQQASDPLKPSVSLLVKLGSIAVHAEEIMSPGRHQFDISAMQTLTEDLEVREWLKQMSQMAWLPVKR